MLKRDGKGRLTRPARAAKVPSSNLNRSRNGQNAACDAQAVFSILELPFRTRRPAAEHLARHTLATAAGVLTPVLLYLAQLDRRLSRIEGQLQARPRDD